MSEDVILAVSLLAALALIGFSARRATLLAAALLPSRGTPEAASPAPSIVLVVPARDEGANVAGLLEAVDRLSYPEDALFVVLVDDASADATRAQLERWAAERPRALALHRAESAGKAGALNAAIAAAPDSDLIAICDADLRPDPDWLRRLAAAFEDEGVGGAAPYLRPRNATSGLVTSYAALETWTHLLVTSAGKDRLGLNPPLLGGSVYRRTALEAVGGFRAGAPGEDVHATLALTRAGWRTRFVEAAIVENTLVEGPRAYWHQHIRWSRNVFAAGAAPPEAPVRPGRRGPPSIARRLEGWFARTGYADRLAFAAAIALAAAGALSPLLPAGYVAVVATESVAGVMRADEARRLPRYLAAAVLLFPLDIAASTAAAAAQLARRPRGWQATRRAERVPESA